LKKEPVVKDNCKRIRQLLDAKAMETALDNMASAVSELISSPENVLVLGMASRGIPLAHKLAERLSNRYHVEIPCGSLDATFYRDDFHYRKPLAATEMRITEMPASVEGKTVILVDDVLYTGRTARAAIQAILDMGRPAAIRFCVLVDRGHRELPIAADAAGLSVKTLANEEVRVLIEPVDPETAVYLVQVENV
jgi:pyrimidine operon attenuation protein/uracil phosphoribosyltransferase